MKTGISFSKGFMSEESVGITLKDGKLRIWASGVDSYVSIELNKDQEKELLEFLKKKDK